MNLVRSCELYPKFIKNVAGQPTHRACFETRWVESSKRGNHTFNKPRCARIRDLAISYHEEKQFVVRIHGIFVRL